MNRFEVPVIVNVVITEDEGKYNVESTYTDSEAAPWPYSGDPTAWYTGDENGDGAQWDNEIGAWPNEFPLDHDALRALWNAAYDAVTEELTRGGDTHGNAA